MYPVIVAPEGVISRGSIPVVTIPKASTGERVAMETPGSYFSKVSNGSSSFSEKSAIDKSSGKKKKKPAQEQLQKGQKDRKDFRENF